MSPLPLPLLSPPPAATGIELGPPDAPALPAVRTVRTVPAATLPVATPLAVTLLAAPEPTHPAALYLASLAQGSQRATRHALTVLRDLLAPGSPIARVPWHLVRFEHAMALRARLCEVYAPATANRILAALRGVLRAAFGLGLASADDLQRVLATKSVRGSRVRKGRALGQAELERLFGACGADTAAAARDAALLAVLYGGGLRRSEVVALDLADVDPRDSTLTIAGKGNKERTMFATEGVRHALRAWVAVRGDWPGPLFCPVTRADVILSRRLSPQAVLDLVGRLADRAGLAHLSPHDFRRTFVGDLLDAGADLATVQALAGHASPTTTSRYDRRGDRARRRAAELLHVPYARAWEAAAAASDSAVRAPQAGPEASAGGGGALSRAAREGQAPSKARARRAAGRRLSAIVPPARSYKGRAGATGGRFHSPRGEQTARLSDLRRTRSPFTPRRSARPVRSAS